MKIIRLFLLGLIVLSASHIFAQNFREALKAPQRDEKAVGLVVVELSARATEDECYQALMAEAAKKYPNQKIEIRNLKTEQSDTPHMMLIGANVVTKVTSDDILPDSLDGLITRLMQSIPQGSRVGLEDISIEDPTERHTVNDMVINKLLDNRYRVIDSAALTRARNDAAAGTRSTDGDVYMISISSTATATRVRLTNVTAGEIISNLTANKDQPAPARSGQ